MLLLLTRALAEEAGRVAEGQECRSQRTPEVRRNATECCVCTYTVDSSDVRIDPISSRDAPAAIRYIQKLTKTYGRGVKSDRLAD